MSTPSLPEFDQLLRLSRGNLDEAELSECHGLLCGLLCCNAAITADAWLKHLAAMQLLVEPGEELRRALLELHERTARQLDDEDFGFELWLPDDDEPLEERTITLARWCAGFLAGIGSICTLESVSGDAQEALADLMEIARAELASGSVEAAEEEEAAYAEIVEYVRVVALTLREEFRGPGNDDPIH